MRRSVRLLRSTWDEGRQLNRRKKAAGDFGTADRAGRAKRKEKIGGVADLLPAGMTDGNTGLGKFFSKGHDVGDDGNRSGVREDRTDSLLSGRRGEPVLIDIRGGDLGNHANAGQARPVEAVARNANGSQRLPFENAESAQTVSDLRLFVASVAQNGMEIREPFMEEVDASGENGGQDPPLRELLSLTDCRELHGREEPYPKQDQERSDVARLHADQKIQAKGTGGRQPKHPVIEK